MKGLLTVLLLITAAMTGVAQAECFQPWNARNDLRGQWIKADCSYGFPPRDGFAGAARTVRLKPGTLVDRFGHPGGRFLAPADASYMGRAVPYDRLKMPYYRYEVVRRLRVAAGKAAPWFDQRWNAVQNRSAGAGSTPRRLPETGLVTLARPRPTLPRLAPRLA